MTAISTLTKQGPGPALRLLVRPGQPPLAVNSTVKVANLNADKVDGLDSSAFLGAGQKAVDAAHADEADSATNADRLDGQEASAFLGAGATAADSELLDGNDSSDFQASSAAAGGSLSGNYPNPGIASGAVGSEQIARGSISGNNIASGAVTATKIADGAVGPNQIATDAVGSDEIAQGAVGSGEIANGTVGTNQINSNQVQRRVSSCPSGGFSIREVAQDGTVVCEANGITGRETVTNSTEFNDNPIKSVTAICPPGKIPISGGGEYSNSATGFGRSGSHDIALQGSRPQSSIFIKEWLAQADWVGEGTPPEWRLIAYAICINP